MKLLILLLGINFKTQAFLARTEGVSHAGVFSLWKECS